MALGNASAYMFLWLLIFISVTYKATRLNSISTNLFIPLLFGETQRPCLKLVSAVLPYLMFGALVLKAAQKRDRVVCSRLSMDLTIFILIKYTRSIAPFPLCPFCFVLSFHNLLVYYIVRL